MTIAKAILNARRGADRLRASIIEQATWLTIASITEETAAIEHLCKLVEANLLKPAPSGDIARELVSRVMGAHDRLVAALKNPGEHMAEAGKRGAKEEPS